MQIDSSKYILTLPAIIHCTPPISIFPLCPVSIGPLCPAHDNLTPLTSMLQSSVLVVGGPENPGQ